MFQNIFTSEPLVVIKDEEERDEFLRRPRYFIPHAMAEAVLALDDLLQLGRGVVRTKGWVAAQENEHDHSQRPHVTGLGVAPPRENLRRNVVDRSQQAALHRIVRPFLVAETEIRDLDLGVCAGRLVKQILGLHVAVNDALLVELAETGGDLGDDFRRVLFGEEGPLLGRGLRLRLRPHRLLVRLLKLQLNPIKKLPAFTQLLD
mmetsp:Transcript_21550/g.45322  ORF Transcript_21550/g.45322 Transcript_21550/m.45322 type:complete len:204 (-) Transcript_21550:628-1239(-)